MNRQIPSSARTASTLSDRKRIRFCPVCGADSFITSNPKGEDSPPEYLNRFICRTCRFEFFVNAAASTMALILKDKDTLLMIRRARDPSKGTLDLPGGFVDIGERAEDAVCREIFEETNLHVSSYMLFPHTYCNEYLYGGVLYHTLDLVYICEVEDWSVLVSNDPDEGQPELVSLSRLNVQDVGLTSVRKFLTEYLETYRPIE